MIVSFFVQLTQLIKWSRMLSLLEIYKNAPGQLLDKGKTTIFFSFNTPEEVRTTITNIAGIKTHGGLEKYLGLPILIGQNKSRHFQILMDKIWSKMSDWKIKFLSKVRKEILLKAVLQAIPTYIMSMFLLPKVILSQLNCLFQKF